MYTEEKVRTADLRIGDKVWFSGSFGIISRLEIRGNSIKVFGSWKKGFVAGCWGLSIPGDQEAYSNPIHWATCHANDEPLWTRQRIEPNHGMLQALKEIAEIQKGMNPKPADNHDYVREARSGAMYGIEPGGDT